jgi:hypothetical protein
MARAVLVSSLLLSFLLGGCAAARRHPRVTTVIASAAIGSVAAGIMSLECSGNESCGADRAATYMVGGALGGAVLGGFLSEGMHPAE